MNVVERKIFQFTLIKTNTNDLTITNNKLRIFLRFVGLKLKIINALHINLNICIYIPYLPISFI